MTTLGWGLLALQAALTVGPAGDHRTVTAALAAAAPGDTVRVAAGVYRERPVIDQLVVLLGEPGAVLDGGGDGTVLTVNATATIRGFVIRGSGRRQAAEHAGILASGAPGLVIEDNRLEDVLFGIYVKQSDRPVIRRNVVIGADVPVARRGDGIRLWYSRDGVIEHNRVRRVRDVVVWFSHRARARGNDVRESRYGLHYMYSNHGLFEDNKFVGNHVGAFLMYSTDITFRRNLLAEARGTTGRGLGFKDADRITAEKNALIRNAVGIFLDNSPHSVGATNHFRGNVVAWNDVGVSLLPSVHDNVFTENTFLDNLRPVAVTGGGTALANRWTGNYWSDYASFDTDGDGIGDRPYVYARLSGDLLARHDELAVFTLSPATAALDLVGRIFPLLEPQPVVVDSFPRLHQTTLARSAAGTGRPVSAVWFAAIAGAAAVFASRARRVFATTS